MTSGPEALAAAGALLGPDQDDGLHAGTSEMAGPAATVARPASRPAIGDLAVADDAGLERRGGDALDAQAAVDGHRGGDDAGRVDVEPTRFLVRLGMGAMESGPACRGERNAP